MSANSTANDDLANNVTTTTTYPILDPTDFQHLSARGLAKVVDDNYIKLHRSLQHNAQPPADFGPWGPSQYPSAQPQQQDSPLPSTSNYNPTSQPDSFITLPRYMGSPHWYTYLGFTPSTASRLSRRFHANPFDVSTTTYGVALSHVQRFRAADLDDGTSAQSRDHLFRLSLLIGFSEEVRRYLCDFPSTSPDNTGGAQAGNGAMYGDGDTVLDWLLDWIYTRNHFLQHVHMYSELRGEWLARAARARMAKTRNDLMRRNMREAQERRRRARRRQLLRNFRGTSPEDREDLVSDSSDSG